MLIVVVVSVCHISSCKDSFRPTNKSAQFDCFGLLLRRGYVSHALWRKHYLILASDVCGCTICLNNCHKAPNKDRGVLIQGEQNHAFHLSPIFHLKAKVKVVV